MTPPASASVCPTIWRRPAASSARGFRRHRSAGRSPLWPAFILVLLCGCTVAETGDVVDQVGHRLSGEPAHRVVTLAPDVTEIVLAVGGGDRLVAVPGAADYPAEVDRYPVVAPGDVESILAFDPDLVIATTAGNDPTVIDRLHQLGVRVMTLDVTGFEALEDAVRLVGRVLRTAPEAGRLAADLHRRWTTARDRAAGLPRVEGLYVVWWDPLIVAAPGTFHDDLLRQAGIDNRVPSGAGRYPRIDPEILLDDAVTTIVAPDEPDVRAGFDRVAAEPVGRRLADSGAGVVWLPADAASRPGPRLVDALEALVSARLGDR